MKKIIKTLALVTASILVAMPVLAESFPDVTATRTLNASSASTTLGIVARNLTNVATATYSAKATDPGLRFTHATSAQTAILPTAVGKNGKIFCAVDGSLSGNTYNKILDGLGAQTIGGNPTLTISKDGGGVCLRSNNTNWEIFIDNSSDAVGSESGNGTYTGNNTFSGNNTFQTGTLAITNGATITGALTSSSGTLAGTWGGTPTINTVWTFSNAPVFSGAVSFTGSPAFTVGTPSFGNGANLGTGTFSGNATLSGNLTLSGNVTMSGTGSKLTGYTQQIVRINSATINATTNPKLIVGVIPRNVTITGISFSTNTTAAANDTNYWTFAATNETASKALLKVDDLNTTKATGGISGGVGITAFAVSAGTLTTSSADLNVSAGDVISVTATKAASAPDLVDFTVVISYKDR